MTVLQRDKHYHTYADYLTWSRDYGDELINGTAYVREPPAPGLSHQRVVGEIHRQVANALKGKPSRVYIAPSDVRLPESTEPGDQVDTVVQPGLLSPVDGASISWPPLHYTRLLCVPTRGKLTTGQQGRWRPTGELRSEVEHERLCKLTVWS